MKVLIAIDGSGSICRDNIQRNVFDCIKDICPQAEIEYCVVSTLGLDMISFDDLKNNVKWFHGAGTDFKSLLDLSDDYDEIKIITDGYFDNDVQIPYNAVLELIPDGYAI